MRKIPTLFVRDQGDRRHVTSEVTPGCEWVLAGEGRPTRKFDGTCVLIRRDGLVVHAFARREVKPGKQPPPSFVEVEHDDETGKTVGWEPAEQSGFAKFIQEAIDHNPDLGPGTYELIGPKIQGNPEGVEAHYLIAHATADDLTNAVKGVPMSYESIKAWMTEAFPYEGVVWHHPDGRMAKIKRRDFPHGGLGDDAD